MIHWLHTRCEKSLQKEYRRALTDEHKTTHLNWWSKCQGHHYTSSLLQLYISRLKNVSTSNIAPSCYLTALDIIQGTDVRVTDDPALTGCTLHLNSQHLRKSVLPSWPCLQGWMGTVCGKCKDHRTWRTALGYLNCSESSRERVPHRKRCPDMRGPFVCNKTKTHHVPCKQGKPDSTSCYSEYKSASILLAIITFSKNLFFLLKNSWQNR